MTEDPVAISDTMLKVTEAAYMARDFDAFQRWFHLPQIVGTFEGDKILRTQDDLAQLFRAMCAQYDRQNVIALHRRTTAARFLDADTVQATFVSRTVGPGHVMSAETVAHGLLRRIDGQWKIAESRYATDNAAVTGALQTFGYRPTDP